MSIPPIVALRRLTLASLFVAGLYVLLDAGLHALLTYGVGQGWAPPGKSEALEREAAQIAAQAAASPAAQRPDLRAAAWRLGRQLGFVSQAGHTAAVTGAADLAALVPRALREANVDAEVLGVAPAAALEGKTFEQAAALTRRIEDDELGIAARIEARTAAQHRHLFIAGMLVGKQMVQRAVPGAPASNLDGPPIERHARLGGLAPEVCAGLAYPKGGDRAARREAFFAAILAADRALARAAVRQ
ncbi:MAG: hypothetical protein ACREXM_03015 [Gammaproteobacteria bacterium]